MFGPRAARLGWYHRESGLKLIGRAISLRRLLGSVLPVRILKMTLGRARPMPRRCRTSQRVGRVQLGRGTYSCPSGHTADIGSSTLFHRLCCANPWAVWRVSGLGGALALSRLRSPNITRAMRLPVLSWRWREPVVLRYWLLPRLGRAPLGAGVRWWSGARRLTAAHNATGIKRPHAPDRLLHALCLRCARGTLAVRAVAAGQIGANLSSMPQTTVRNGV